MYIYIYIYTINNTHSRTTTIFQWIFKSVIMKHDRMFFFLSWNDWNFYPLNEMSVTIVFSTIKITWFYFRCRNIQRPILLCIQSRWNLFHTTDGMWASERMNERVTNECIQSNSSYILDVFYIEEYPNGFSLEKSTTIQKKIQKQHIDKTHVWSGFNFFFFVFIQSLCFFACNLSHIWLTYTNNF